MITPEGYIPPSLGKGASMSREEIVTRVCKCDLCKKEVRSADLRTLYNQANGLAFQTTNSGLKAIDVCTECQSRPISEVLKLMDQGTIKVRHSAV